MTFESSEVVEFIFRFNEHVSRAFALRENNYIIVWWGQVI